MRTYPMDPLGVRNGTWWIGNALYDTSKIVFSKKRVLKRTSAGRGTAVSLKTVSLLLNRVETREKQFEKFSLENCPAKVFEKFRSRLGFRSRIAKKFAKVGSPLRPETTQNVYQ